MAKNLHLTKSHLVAIDLGSNSFHMIIARQDHNEIRTLERIGEKVQLALGLNEKSQLTDEAMQRGWSCLRKFAQYIEGMPAGIIRVVGTNALRQARNREVFISEARKILKCPVEVIRGREEARLIYLGVAHTQADDEGRRLVIDIGGGSTEFIIGEYFEPHLLESLHMGCVNYSQRFFTDGKLSAKRVRKLFYAARLELLNIQQSFCRSGWTNAVGASGTIKSVIQVIEALGLGSSITSEALKQLHKKILQFDNLQEMDLPGLTPERASIFPAGVTILRAIFKSLRIKELRFSSGALREGLLYDMVGRLHHEDVRERTVTAMAGRYHVQKTQALRVRKTVMALFKQVAHPWGLSKHQGNLLSWAANLHEVGLDISHANFHKHGAYLVKNSDMMGFTREQQQELAFLVRSHRRSFPAKYFSEEQLKERDSSLKLCILLRLAVVLNRGRKDKPQPLPELLCDEKSLTLVWPENYLADHPLTLADLNKEAKYLSKVSYRLTFSE